MILISAILVLAAVALLIIGFLISAPTLIATSIGVSVLATLSLAVSTYIRRDKLLRSQPPARAAPTLEEELAVLAVTLQRQARRLAEIESGVRARAAAAERLQLEAEEQDKRAKESREYADAQQKAAEAVEALLKSRTDTMAEFFTKRTSKTQIWYLVIGALLGGIVGVGLQELVNLL